MNVCWLSIKKAPLESLRWHKYSAKLIFLHDNWFYALYICTISKHFQFRLDPPKYGEHRARAECTYHGGVHNYCRGTDYSNSVFFWDQISCPYCWGVLSERLKCILQLCKHFLHNCNCFWPTSSCSYNHILTPFWIGPSHKPCNQKLS